MRLRTGVLAVAAITSVVVAGVALAQNEPAEPSAAAQLAIATLEAPSVASPLPDSVRVDETTYQIAGACAAARDAYLAPGAPLPAGAVVTPTGSTLTIDLPYAQSGILFRDVPSAGHCLYSIEQAPTLSITGVVPGLPSGDFFALVLCDEDEGLTAIGEVVPVGGAPALVLLSPEEGIITAPGSLEDAVGTESVPPLDASLVLEGTAAAFSATVTFPDGSTAQLAGKCTGSVFDLVQAAT